MTRGMTLITVLIAVAVLVIGVLALMRVYPVITRLSERSRSHTAAEAIADRVFAELRESYAGEGKPAPPASLSGTDEGFPGYAWRADFAEEREGLYRVSLEVSWTREGKRAFEDFQETLRR